MIDTHSHTYTHKSGTLLTPGTVLSAADNVERVFMMGETLRH